MLKLKTLENVNFNLSNKVVLCRVDLNVPMKGGRVIDKTRIEKLVPTFEFLIKKNAKIVILSHFGRPKGEYNREMSLAPLTNAISESLGGRHVNFAVDCIGETAKQAIAKLKAGEILLLENLRFHKGEEANDPSFVTDLAALGDFFVNDTFSCSHRAHASIVGLAQKLPAAAGLLMQDEVDNLERILQHPKKPVAAMVGGSKVSTKLGILNSLIAKVDYLIIGGAMANTFLAAKGVNIGNSFYEKDFVKMAKEIISHAGNNSCEIILPKDVVLADKLEENAKCDVVDVSKIPSNKMALDIGPDSVCHIITILNDCKTVVWNGPLGAFEYKPFDNSTIFLARHIAKLTNDSKLISIAGGGDVVASLSGAGVVDAFTYISTAGGAFLEWLEGKELPGISALKEEDSVLERISH